MIFDILIRVILEGLVLIVALAWMAVELLQGRFIVAGLVAFGAYVVHGLVAPRPRERKVLAQYLAQIRRDRERGK